MLVKLAARGTGRVVVDAVNFIAFTKPNVGLRTRFDIEDNHLGMIANKQKMCGAALSAVRFRHHTTSQVAALSYVAVGSGEEGNPQVAPLHLERAGQVCALCLGGLAGAFLSRPLTTGGSGHGHASANRQLHHHDFPTLHRWGINRWEPSQGWTVGKILTVKPKRVGSSTNTNIMISLILK